MPKIRSRILVEESRTQLDINLLNRVGALIVGAIVEIRWPDGCEVKLHITGTPEHPDRAGNLQIDGVDTIELVWSACTFGGVRPWVLCPGCRRQSTKLLDYHSRAYRCRRCWQAGYRSENLTPEWRMRRRINKLQARLDDGLRPRGMHAVTFEKLCSEIEDLEAVADWLLLEKLERRMPDLFS